MKNKFLAKLKKFHKKHKHHVTPKNAVLLAVGVFLFSMYLQVQTLVGHFSFLEGRDSSLITEIGQMKDAYLTVGRDLNEVRSFLRLEPGEYKGFENSTSRAEDENDDDLQLSLFKYIDSYSTNSEFEKRLAQNTVLIKGLATSETFASFLAQELLGKTELYENGESYSLSILGTRGETLIYFFLGKDDGKLFQKTVRDKDIVEFESLAEFEEDLSAVLAKDKDELAKAVNDLAALRNETEAAINSVSVQAVLSTEKLKLNTDYRSADLSYTYSIYNQSDELVGEVVINTDKLALWFFDVATGDSDKVNVVRDELPAFLETLDSRSFTQKKVEESLANINESINDRGFQLLLRDSNMSISETAREDAFRYYFDVYEGDKHLSSIVIEKATGVVNIVAPDGSQAENLLFFDPEFKKKTVEIPDAVPNYGKNLSHKEGTLNILIAGKQGMNVDTMIFAHIDDSDRTVSMISIPRDLFYEGRKINALAFYYGMPELKKAISKISGYQIDKYVLIDMYAFIDVVDLIGGIDFHLDSALVDPSYKVVNKGIASTLHYDAGDYHLSGVEALRLARSRKTSSDFARAERQQQILGAIQDKARNLGFGDADTVYQIIKTVLNKTETDISVEEAVGFFFRYQDYELASMDVMTSANVLYVPKYITTENCEAMAAAGEEIDCETTNNAYTLLPKDGNWDLVKWFFKDKFEGVR